MPREAQKSDPVLEFFPPEEAERAESAPRPTPILSDVVQKRHAVHPPPPIDDSVARIPALSVLDDAEGNEEKPWTLPVAEESDSEAPTVPPPHPEEYKETVRRLSMQAPDEKAGDETKEAPPPVSDVRTNLRRGAALALQSDGPQSQPDPELQKILEKRIEEAIWGFYSIGIDVEPRFEEAILHVDLHIATIPEKRAASLPIKYLEAHGICAGERLVLVVGEAPLVRNGVSDGCRRLRSIQG